MGSSSSRRGLMKVFLVVVLMLVVVMNWEIVRKVDAVTAAECKVERRLLVNACKDVVGGSPASAYCCKRIRVTHIIECVCPVITPKLAALIDVNKAVRVIQGCGKRVPRHFKCGSITTP
ncbi:Bifunctional inhibitor/plant lipid transfer protein/seed storage helical domain [Macleaya cordata]|uniref:Bifunctional inhibitor/plant lipid transfer protein/seed storage helical domain n=1 Tax=Macleaya cordata TaxID=56857 RepID=A0A200Q439_MACCD|nr:Bifunctional inhibitor/plant lipid transfer protein/seed storage helical domain [Macleaya cordata]